MHEQRQTKTRDSKDVPEGAVPAYLLDREGQSRAKVLSNMVKQKRKEKAVSTCMETLTLDKCLVIPHTVSSQCVGFVYCKSWESLRTLCTMVYLDSIHTVKCGYFLTQKVEFEDKMHC